MGSRKHPADLLFNPLPPELSKSLPSILSLRSASKRARSASSLRMCLSTCTQGRATSHCAEPGPQGPPRAARTSPAGGFRAWTSTCSDTSAGQIRPRKDHGGAGRHRLVRCNGPGAASPRRIRIYKSEQRAGPHPSALGTGAAAREKAAGARPAAQGSCPRARPCTADPPAADHRQARKSQPPREERRQPRVGK